MQYLPVSSGLLAACISGKFQGVMHLQLEFEVMYPISYWNGLFTSLLYLCIYLLLGGGGGGEAGIEDLESRIEPSKIIAVRCGDLRFSKA